MQQTKNRNSILMAAGAALIAGMPLTASAQADLRQRVNQLEQELADARAELADAEATLENAADTGPEGIYFGDLRIGGAIRANYTIGDYAEGAGPTRGGDGGNFALDTFRLNLDYADDAGFLGKVEYRWYNGYNFLHTGWVGYQIDESSQVQVGVNRVPFGASAYGTYNSWIAGQHYYVGLADDMDLGIKYSTTIGNLALDLAYYVSDEGQWRGASRDSARYSYDPVLTGTGGYQEEHTFNARGIFTVAEGTEIGVSGQYGQLDGTDNTDGQIEDGEHYAVSGHVISTVAGVTLKAQASYYHYDIEDDNPWGDAELIPFGAFDFAWPIAAEAVVYSGSASYMINTPNIAWLDYVNTYVEYSTIQKSEDSHNDSDLLNIGAMWARGGWYIYTEWSYSNGNYFVGSTGDDYSVPDFGGVGDFGVNGNDKWNSRYNINFGYYF